MNIIHISNMLTKEECIFGQQVSLEEGQYIEFKSFTTDKLTQKKISDKSLNYFEDYFLGFMNANFDQDSFLYMGVDDNGLIQGVPIERNTRDKIQKLLSSKLQQKFNRKINPEICSVNFLKVSECPEDYYIIEFVIGSHPKKEFFYTRKGSSTVYLRDGATNPKIQSDQLLKEIIRGRKVNRLTRESQELKDQIVNDKNNIDLRYQLIKILEELGDAKSIAGHYEKIIQIRTNKGIQDSENDSVRMQLAKSLERLENSEGALDVLETVQDKNNDDFKREKSKILSSLHKEQEAISILESIVENNPQDYLSITQMGLMYYKQQSWIESIRCFSKALKIEPRYRFAKYWKKSAYHQMLAKNGQC